MKKCPYCGRELDDDARACDNCGRPLPAMVQPEQKAASGNPTGNAGEQDPWQEEVKPEEGNGPIYEKQDNAPQGGDNSQGQSQWNPGQNQWNPDQNQWNSGQNQWNSGQNQWNPGQNQWNQNQQNYNAQGPVGNSPFAVSALAIGIASIFFQWFIPFFSVVAIGLGIAALLHIRKADGMYKGKGLAITAIILGAAVTVIYFVFMVIALRMMQTPEFSQYMKEFMKEYESILGSSAASSSSSSLLTWIRSIGL